MLANDSESISKLRQPTPLRRVLTGLLVIGVFSGLASLYKALGNSETYSVALALLISFLIYDWLIHD